MHIEKLNKFATQDHIIKAQDMCEYFTYQEDTNGEVVLVYCNHPLNTDKYEGNCTHSNCPNIEEIR